MIYTATIVMEYKDGTEMIFDVTTEGKESKIVAFFQMITSATLMASTCNKATCYNEEGFEICSYKK